MYLGTFGVIQLNTYALLSSCGLFKLDTNIIKRNCLLAVIPSSVVFERSREK